MAAAGPGAPAAVALDTAPAPRVHPSRLDLAAAAWLAAIPCALVVGAVALVLGPVLGPLLSPIPGGYTFLPEFARGVRPEPTEHARYLIAAAGPFVLALAIAGAPRWLGRIPTRIRRLLTVASQLVLVVVVVASIVAQYRYRFGDLYTNGFHQPFTARYFPPVMLASAVAIAAMLFVTLRVTPVRRRAAALLRARWSVAILAIVIAVTAIWMLHAVYTDVTVTNAPEGFAYHLGFTIDETFAVLNGRTPLVNFTAQYAQLWPFVLALPMLAFGKTVLTFTIALCTITAFALLGVYDVLRRVTGSALAALLLYLPFLAMSLFMLVGPREYRSTAATYYAAFPLRYALPLLVAWLTARYLARGERGRRTWPLFVVAGLALINNGDFGVAAFGATVAALLCATTTLSRAWLVRLGGAVVAGLAMACALVVLLTLMRAGALPQPARWMDYARLYALAGFALLPIPGVLGLHLLLYLTYVATITVAVVRGLRAAPNPVLTGMLMWSGVFGLGAGFYYVGRSHPGSLGYEFPAWALALVLLTVVAVGELSVPRLRSTAIGAVVVLFGFGLATCSLPQVPMPWEQLARLRAPAVPTEEEPVASPLLPPRNAATRRFVASLADGPSHFVVKRGAPVAILLSAGHRVADAYGVVDVAPYTGAESLERVERVEGTLDALREAGGNTVILPDPLKKSIGPLLARRGFEVLTVNGLRRITGPDFPVPLERPWRSGMGLMKLVDTRHLHPRALRE